MKQDITFTDAEKRIFLAAMGRERGICEKTDAEMRDTNDPAAVNLVRICDNIEKKVRAALWTEPAASFPQRHENDHIAEVSKMDLPSAEPDTPMRGSKSAEIAGNITDRTTGDCISRQAAIDATWKEPSYTDPLNVLTEVRERIEQLPSAQPEQRWIPCSERLPDKCDKYLVQALGDCIFVDQWRTDQGGYWTAKTPIVAWMPLPEPWKGDAE